MPLPEPRMLGKAWEVAHEGGSPPDSLLRLSARMESLGNELAPPQESGRPPSRPLSVRVSSLCDVHTGAHKVRLPLQQSTVHHALHLLSYALTPSKTPRAKLGTRVLH